MRVLFHYQSAVGALKVMFSIHFPNNEGNSAKSSWFAVSLFMFACLHVRARTTK